MQENTQEGENEKTGKPTQKNEHVEEAHREAEEDIKEDPSMEIPSTEKDFLDEGELARKEGHP